MTIQRFFDLVAFATVVLVVLFVITATGMLHGTEYNIPGASYIGHLTLDLFGLTPTEVDGDFWSPCPAHCPPQDIDSQLLPAEAVS